MKFRKIAAPVLVAAMLLSALFVLSSCAKKNDGKLVCGVTEYEPMNYLDASGKWTGFDTEFALLVGEKLGMDVEFTKIEWTYKFTELKSGAINCIWNGFTANSAEADGTPRTELVDFSYSYMLNQQCVVIKADRAGDFASLEALAGKTAAAEKGSAGESAAKDILGESGTLIDSAAQVNTFLEVKSGAVDFAVVDILLAKSLTGKGNYSDLAIAGIELDSEVYAIGFAKGDPLRDKVNGAIKELFEEGKLAELAEKYGLENMLTLDTSFPG